MTRGFIICVDDEQAVLNQLSAQLRRHFTKTHDIEAAESADEALDIISELTGDGATLELIICDQIMPGLKGDKLLEIIHYKYPQAMKILLTGQAGLESAIYAINHAGLHKYIEKPWTEEDLILTVQGLLRQFKYGQDIRSLQSIALELQTMLDDRHVVDFLPQALQSLLPVGRALLVTDTAKQEGELPQPQIRYHDDWPGPLEDKEASHFLSALWLVLHMNPSAVLVGGDDPAWKEVRALLPTIPGPLLAAPLWGGGTLMGGIVLAERQGGLDFVMEDTEILTLLATQVGSTLKRINLQKRLQHETLLRATYERYLSRPVVERLLSHPDEGWQLGGSEREVTILFADLRGFTSLAENISPTTTVALLNHWFSAMTELVFKYEGTLDKYIGDSVMAVFGAPFPQEDHALRAIHCAVDMQHVMDQINPELHEKFGLILTMGIGINGGRVTAGNVGSEHRLEYTVIGDAVNLAARLEATATAGRIFLSRYVWEQARDAVALESDRLGIKWGELATLNIKGKSLEVEAIEVMWRGDQPAKEAAVDGGQPAVGSGS